MEADKEVLDSIEAKTSLYVCKYLVYLVKCKRFHGFVAFIQKMTEMLYVCINNIQFVMVVTMVCRYFESLL